MTTTDPRAIIAERIARANTLLNEDLTELFEVHELNPGDRLDRNAVEQLAERLRDHAASIDPLRAYEQDRYPVIVDVTQRYVLWVEADDADDALTSVKDDGSWYERLEGETEVTAWHEVSAPDRYDIRTEVYGEPFGPARQCPECQRPPYAVGVLHVVHHHDCSTFAVPAEAEAR
jgi:hypothetical protein